MSSIKLLIKLEALEVVDIRGLPWTLVDIHGQKNCPRASTSVHGSPRKSTTSRTSSLINNRAGHPGYLMIGSRSDPFPAETQMYDFQELYDRQRVY